MLEIYTIFERSGAGWNNEIRIYSLLPFVALPHFCPRPKKSWIDRSFFPPLFFTWRFQRPGNLKFLRKDPGQVGNREIRKYSLLPFVALPHFAHDPTKSWIGRLFFPSPFFTWSFQRLGNLEFFKKQNAKETEGSFRELKLLRSCMRSHTMTAF